MFPPVAFDYDSLPNSHFLRETLPAPTYPAPFGMGMQLSRCELAQYDNESSSSSSLRSTPPGSYYTDDFPNRQLFTPPPPDSPPPDSIAPAQLFSDYSDAPYETLDTFRPDASFPPECQAPCSPISPPNDTVFLCKKEEEEDTFPYASDGDDDDDDQDYVEKKSRKRGRYISLHHSSRRPARTVCSSSPPTTRPPSTTTAPQRRSNSRQHPPPRNKQVNVDLKRIDEYNFVCPVEDCKWNKKHPESYLTSVVDSKRKGNKRKLEGPSPPRLPDFRRHLTSHSKPVHIICKMCQKSFSRSDALSRHKRNAHSA